METRFLSQSLPLKYDKVLKPFSEREKGKMWSFCSYLCIESVLLNINI